MAVKSPSIPGTVSREGVPEQRGDIARITRGDLFDNYRTVLSRFYLGFD